MLNNLIIINRPLKRAFNRAREIGTKVDEKILELGVKAGILNEPDPFIEDVVVKNAMKSSINETLTTFNKQNNSLLRSAGDEYTQIVNNVTTQVISGTKTVAKAMQDSVSKLAEKGLTGFTARNGAQWTPEAYTKMVLRTNVRQATNNMQEERFKQYGNDYIEISQHMGARPLCAEDQGKIFSLSGNVEPIIDGLGNKIQVYDWNKSSYGEPAGILGINCGHSRYAFVPNVSIHREKHIKKAENDEAYQEKQQQRYYERTIRNKKREISMLKETKAEPTYIKQKQNQLSNYRKQYVDFLDNTGRTRITGNEWIGSSKMTKSQSQKASSTYNNWVNKEKAKEKLLKEAKKVYNNITDDEALNAYKQLLARNKKIENNKELLKINEDKQLKHNINSDKYVKGKSYFNIDLKEEQELVDRYATKGYTPLTKSNNIQSKEICTTDKNIGVYINDNYGTHEVTNSFVIHYSTKGKGVHIVPASNNSQIKIEKGDTNDK